MKRHHILAGKDSNLDNLSRIVSKNEFETKKAFEAKDFSKGNDRNFQRNLSKWEAQGILFESTFDKNKKRKYSFVEVIWIKIVQELKSIGYPKNLLTEAQEALSMRQSYLQMLMQVMEISARMLNQTSQPTVEKQEKETQNFDLKDETSVLGWAIAICIDNKTPVKIVFDSAGNAIVIDFSDPNSAELLRELTDSTFVLISLDSILKDLILDDNFNFMLPKLHYLTEEEFEIIKELRSGEVEQLTVKFQGKEELLIERLVAINGDPAKRIAEILSNGDYEDILIKKRNKKIVYSKRLELRKIKRSK